MKEQIIQLVWNDDACEYLRGIRRCSSSAKKKRERHSKREMEKSTSTTRSIVDTFSAQFNKNQSRDECVLSTSPPAIFLPKNTGKEVEETRFESQTRAVYDLSELLRLKTVQMNKYEHVLGYQSNLYWRHQMVQSFLWMKLNEKKDNPGLNRQSLAQIVTNSFNRLAYTGWKIIQWKRSWVKDRIIPRIKAKKHKHVVSLMGNKDLILSVKEWSGKSRENKMIF